MAANKEAEELALSFPSPPSMSTPIKRPPRTYGRPKDTVPGETNPSLQHSGSAWAGGSAIYGAGTSHLVQKQPERPLPSRRSSLSDVADDQSSDGEAGDASGGFQFGWRAKMKEIDENMAADGEDSTVPAVQDASPPPPHPSDDASRTSPNSPSLQDSPAVVEDVFGASIPTLTASSGFESRSPPASPPPILSRKRKQLVVPNSSDEDSEDDTKASGRRSRVAPHPITTPKSRPSSTPPTSDDEMPSRIASDPRSKGKGKPSTSRTQVPALQFNDEPSVSHRKRLSEPLTAHTKSKFKAPTKKEKLETVRDRGRIAGGQRAAVQPAEASMRYSLNNFFLDVQKSTLGRTASLDDPISSFSSSPGERPAPMTVELTDLVATPLLQATVPATTELRALDDSDNENLPDVGDILSGVTKEKTKTEKLRELNAMKLRLAAQSQPAAVSDDEDDFEIIGAGETKTKDIATERASGGTQKPSAGRKRQLALGGISLAEQRAKQRETPPKPLGLTSVRRTQDQLAKDLAMIVAQKNAEMTKNKEDEWVRRGGRVVEVGGEDVDALRNATLKQYAEKGQKNAEAREARMQDDFEEDDDDDANDADWSETRGSASPRPQQGSDADEEDADTTMVNDEEDEDDDDNEENEAPSVLNRGPRRTIAIIDSDSENENDENAVPVRKSASFILRENTHGQDEVDENVSPIELTGAVLHRGSVSSMDERTEDEGDKENNTHLMYDKSEDKENKAVPRHPFGARPALGRQGSLFGLEEGMQRSLSMSPGEHEPMNDGTDNENDENDAGGDRRRPLQNLLAEEDPFLAEPGPSASVDFATRLQQTSSLPLDTPDATLRPSFEIGARVGGKSVAFSQFSDDGATSFKGAPLQPGFSDLFEAGTEQQQSPKRPLALSASFSAKPDAGLFGLRQTTVALGLTQDLDLEPAFEVGDHLKRQADAIFEKEQEYVWNAANRKADTKKQELFLTQTRPDVEKPEIYTLSSPAESGSVFGTQRSALLEPHSSLRRPLRTLSLTESVELDAPERSPLRRLAKRTRTPSPTSSRSSPSPSPAMRTKNALDLLRRETLGIHAPRPRKPLDKSEYVAEEAQESDDDEMGGFMHKGDDGEEEGGEDLDRTLTTLVDDTEMSEEKVAEARVREKFQEQTHEDDLEIEKFHQGVVQGDLRKKRRNRGLLDDSDEEDEEDEMRARKMRRGLAEPTINRGDVNELAKDPHTRAFYEVYHTDLQRGEEAEFAHLQESQPEIADDAEMADEDEGGREVLTRKELTEKLREVARREQDDQPEMDVEDVSWVDRENSDGEDQVKVKAVSLRRSVAEARNQVESPERKRMNNWAKTEGRTRNAGTGRASGRTAVTGQMSKAKAGGGSLRTSVVQSQSGAKPAEARRPLKMQPSVLAVVASDRSARFV
ncbi:MRC1-like domain-containing protein [Mycena rosella]|uniref:MRC1-like domain-containing protein n=1 Tax=Mycena rosella TaxID=1033263 RepID=A0AAD7DFN4_MYCRO|nr:MRC1-like domain-containing protein [Mycena rosella]